ncbi:MAG: SpoIIE family protein phosphatase [Pseudomonadota bacterium]
MTWPGRAQLAGALTASRLLGLILLATIVAFVVWRGLDAESSWRNAWWDAQQRLLPRDRGDPKDAPAVVVAIDHSSMEQILPWPWPRNYLAFLVEEIARNGASAVALDILLLDPDAQSPVQQAARYRARGLSDLADNLQRLGDTDQVMTEALAATPSVMPLIGEPAEPGADTTEACDYKAPAVTLTDARIAPASTYAEADVPLADFTNAAQGLAAINFQATDDFIVRRVPAVQIICDKPILLLGAEAMRVADGGFFSSVAAAPDGLRIHLGDAEDPATAMLPAEHDGSFWLHYGPVNSVSIEESLEAGTIPELDRYIPAWQVLQPDFDRARLDGRIVLLAVVDLGRIDERQSPLGEVIFGVEAHLQMIEMVRDGTFLRRFDWLPGLELAALIIGGLAIILFVPLASPAWAVVATAAGIVASFLVSLVLFRAGLLIDVATPAIGWVGSAIGVIAVNLIERDRARLQSEIALQSERADRAFLQGELDAAARIQTALLPARRYTKDGRVDLACYMDPARTIGGDFYDHMLIDDRHLFFLVADVSGKGADASQFMLLSKTLWKSVALRTGSELDRIQLDANSEITRENTAMMFVTGLVGILDLDTGELSYSSAGHDSPYLFADDKVPQQLDSFAGPPAGLVEGMDFPVGRVTLAKGERLCIFTDGVTEAMNEERELYGLERLEAALGTAPPGLDSAGLVDHVVGRVRTFSGAAEQSDDITLMVISLG